VGTFVIVPRVEMVEIAAIAGFDLVVLDWEHGPFGVESSPPLVIAGQRLGIFVVVRVPAGRPELIGAALDVGADGVIVPHVDGAERARASAAAVRFSPDGDRSANPWVRAARYSGAAEHFAFANRASACIATIEGASGVEHADEIITTPGVDAIFIGPVDLSASLGVPGEVDHPLVAATISRLIDAAAAHSVAVSIFAPNSASAGRRLGQGARLVLLSVDTALTLSGFTSAIAGLRSPA
jgi:4-hydroxy-2-oxoheptanedioate aldolase